MFDELRALGIPLDELGESCLQKQIEELTGNINEEDLNNKDFMRGVSRVLCGALNYFVNSDYPSPFKYMMLYAWIKYTFMAAIELKRQRGFDLSYEIKTNTIDEFKDLDKDFDTKVTLAQEGERNERETGGSEVQ